MKKGRPFARDPNSAGPGPPDCSEHFTHNIQSASDFSANTMSSRQKKRQLTYTGHYKQSLRQSILAPRDRVVQRLLKTPKPASISKKRQETLTQIGYAVSAQPQMNWNVRVQTAPSLAAISRRHYMVGSVGRLVQNHK